MERNTVKPRFVNAGRLAVETALGVGLCRHKTRLRGSNSEPGERRGGSPQALRRGFTRQFFNHLQVCEPFHT